MGQVWYLIVSIPNLCTLTYLEAGISAYCVYIYEVKPIGSIPSLEILMGIRIRLKVDRDAKWQNIRQSILFYVIF